MLNNKPHFFQPLFPGFRKELLIPVAFFKRHLHGKKLKKALLRGQETKLWPVKINGRQLADGWREFVASQDFRVGDVLVFRYEGGLQFDVMAFDSTTCEREYEEVEFKQEVEAEEEEEDNDDDDDGDDDDEDYDYEEEEEEEDDDDDDGGGGCAGGGVLSSFDFPRLERKDETEKEPKSDAAEAGTSSTKHPYYLSTIKAWNIQRGKLYLPSPFAKKIELSSTRCEMILENERGLSWKVSLNKCSKPFQVYIGRGWKTFVCENGIKEGDAFSMELIKGGKEQFLRLLRIDLSGLQRNNETKSDDASFTRSPYFSSTFQAWNKAKLYIPKLFASKVGLTTKSCEIFIQNERGKSWAVTMRQSERGLVFLGKGWYMFVKENGLKEGDAFMIELIQEGQKPSLRLLRLD